MKNKLLTMLFLSAFMLCTFADYERISGEIKLDRDSCDSVLISFSGFDWWVKEGFYGPGPNHFSSENVWLDGENNLHLIIEKRDSIWYCAEVYSDKVGWGYGMYRFYISSRVDNLDSAVVLGLFTYDYTPPCQTFDCGEIGDCCDLYHCHCREIDIEFCTGWGNTGYFSVQPNRTSGECYGYDFALSGDSTTFQFEWLPGQVDFHGTHGHHSEMIYPIPAEPYLFAPGIVCDEETLDFSTCPDCVFSPGNERVHINLWLWDINGDGIGDSLTSCETVEIIIDSFEFIPDESVSVTDNISQTPVPVDIVLNPNPFNSGVRLQVSGVGEQEIGVEIYDLRGNIVGAALAPPTFKGAASSAPTNRTFTWIPDESITSGVYLVRVNLDDCKISRRIIYIK